MPTDAMTGLPSGVPPEDFSAFYDAQRKQMLASMLLNSMQSSGQTPQNWNSMKVVPRRGAMLNIAPLLTSLMAGRALKDTTTSQAGLASQLNQAYAPGGQPMSSGTPLQAQPPPADPNSQDVQPVIQRLPGASLDQTVQASQPTYAPQNPRNPYGLPADVVRNLAMTNPEAYAKYLQGPDWAQQARAAGIPLNMAGRGMLAKATTIEGRPGASATDLAGNTTLNADPSRGESYITLPGGQIVAIPIANSAAIQGQRAGVTTASTAANTPHYEPDPFHPGQVKVAYPPAGPALAGTAPVPAVSAQGTVAPPGAPQVPHPAAPPSTGTQPGNTALALEQQKEAGKAGAQSGQTYADQLNKNAISATEVRRSLAELKNLSTSAAPGAMNSAKLETGSYMIAAGMAPATVSKLLGVDIDALTAASKQTGSLALDSIHDMTSRGTNFDLATFMRYNPNLNMASPGGFSRVLDFMDKRMQQEVAKQADFSQWSSGVPSNQWATGHTARWLKLQNDLISSGKTNSRRPLTSFEQPTGTP